ncbi:OmpH family outer membrane protein [Marinimicrobium sp. C2-29]|uniref:OmpH family outer membrane protein n=1 Tax=Marinimicrobium sp. C2-29 TaxID=3139825 RepID=UPI003139C5EB
MFCKAWLLGCLVFLACGFTRADAPIAVVDLTDAIFASKVAVARLEALRDSPTYQRYQSALEGGEADLQNLASRMNTPGLSEQHRTMVRERAEHIRRETVETGRALEQWLQSQKQALFDELSPLAREALDDLARQRQLDLIIAEDAIIYARGQWVLTDQVTQWIDEHVAPDGTRIELREE